MLDQWLDKLVGPVSLGELNYILTRLIQRTLSNVEVKSYGDIVLTLGTLEAVKQEFYRRAAARYEDKKRDENGDIWVWR